MPPGRAAGQTRPFAVVVEESGGTAIDGTTVTWSTSDAAVATITWMLSDAGKATPREAARGAELVLSVVTDSPDAREVLLGAEGAVQSVGQRCVDGAHVGSNTVGGYRVKRLRRHGVVDAPMIMRC